MPNLSPRRIAIVLGGVAVAWMFATCTLEAFGAKPVSTSTEREGSYELRYATYDAFGHRATRVDVYWVGSGRTTLVSKRVGRRFLAPGDPSLMLFEHCAEAGEPRCGAYVWDGHTRTTRRISAVHPITLFAMQQPWSPDRRSVALVGQDGGEVVHVESGRTTDLASLRLALPRRGISHAGWRGDGRLVVTVVEHPNADGPFVNGRQRPYLVDPVAGVVSPLGGL